MTSLNAANEYHNSQLSADYDRANQRYTEALLAGVDDKKAQHDLDARCETADNHYTEALEQMEEEGHAPLVVEARLADDDEQSNYNFVVVAEEV